MSSTIPFRPKLIVHRGFMQEFISAEPPCLALGLVEEQNRLSGFWALRTTEAIPPEVSAKGMNFGHSLLGTSEMEVIQFSFEFYGFETLQRARQSQQPRCARRARSHDGSRGLLLFCFGPEQPRHGVS